MLRLIIFTFFIAVISFSGYSQDTDQQKKQREKFEKEMEKRQDEAISDFVDELETDDFTKEIISQKLHSYAQKKQQIFRQQLRQIQRKEKLDYLNDTHFVSLKSMASPEVMNQIHDFVTMTPTDIKKKEKEKEKKKRKRKKKNKNDEETDNL